MTPLTKLSREQAARCFQLAYDMESLPTEFSLTERVGGIFIQEQGESAWNVLGLFDNGSLLAETRKGISLQVNARAVVRYLDTLDE